MPSVADSNLSERLPTNLGVRYGATV